MFHTTFIIGLSIDILSKYIAAEYLDKPIPIIGDFLYLQLIYNPGIAFGIKVPLSLLKIGTIALIIGIYYYYKDEKKKNLNSTGSRGGANSGLLDISFGLILAGAIGNGIERILYEKVVDFIGIQSFSVFNLADSFISIGAVLLIYYYHKTK